MSKKAICHDCGAEEGQIHQLGCDMEYCPYCGGQLLSCFCCYEQLGIVNKKKYGPETSHLPRTVYEHGLSPTQFGKWDTLLEKKGRIPYIQYPNLCAKCGALWPDFFMVPDSEWEHYIQPDMRDKVICRPCYDYIKKVIDEAQP